MGIKIGDKMFLLGVDAHVEMDKLGSADEY